MLIILNTALLLPALRLYISNIVRAFLGCWKSDWLCEYWMIMGSATRNTAASSSAIWCQPALAGGCHSRQLPANSVEKLGKWATSKFPPNSIVSDFLRSRPSKIGCGYS
jgi:hypothetical protein